MKGHLSGLISILWHLLGRQDTTSCDCPPISLNTHYPCPGLPPLQPWQVRRSQRSTSSQAAHFPSRTSSKLIPPTTTHKKTTPLSSCPDLSAEPGLARPPAYLASPPRWPTAPQAHVRPITDKTFSPKPAPVLPSELRVALPPSFLCLCLCLMYLDTGACYLFSYQLSDPPGTVAPPEFAFITCLDHCNHLLAGFPNLALFFR